MNSLFYCYLCGSWHGRFDRCRFDHGDIEDRFITWADTIPDIIIMSDEDGRVTVNRREDIF